MDTFKAKIALENLNCPSKAQNDNKTNFSHHLILNFIFSILSLYLHSSQFSLQHSSFFFTTFHNTLRSKAPLFTNKAKAPLVIIKGKEKLLWKMNLAILPQ